MREIVAGFLGFSKSSRKTTHTISHSSLNSFLISLLLWSVLKEKGSWSSKAVSSAKVLSVLNEDEIQEQIGRHVVSKYKEDEYKDIGGTSFGFMEDISNVSWP